MTPTIIGTRVRTARKMKGLTLAQLGKLLGLSVPFLHLIEKGKSKIPPLRRVEFAAALGLSQNDLTELDRDTLSTIADMLTAYGGCERAANYLREIRGAL